MKILVLNSGSSSQKSCLYEIGDALSALPPEPVWQGHVEWDGGRAELQVHTSQGANFKEQLKIESREQAFEPLLETLWSGKTRVISGPSEIQMAGHRIVNGGPKYAQPAIVNPEVKAAIASMSAFAALHNCAGLEG